MLDDQGLKLLNIRYKTNLKLDQYEVGENKDIDDEADDEKSRSGNTAMAVTLLHLAIIAKQTNVIRVIFDCIVSKSCQYIEETEESDRKQKVNSALQEELEKPVVLGFVYPTETYVYDKEDRSIDGMNAIHLACKYHPKAIPVIFGILKNQDVSDLCEYILAKTDNHLKQTPLHVAARSSTAVATRYD